MREVVFDTETTGFDPFNGDRVVEIGCVVVDDYLPTGEVYHVYINPERDMPTAAVNVHGLTEEFLADKPTFSEIVADFRDFCGDMNLVAHNAEFDMKFINWEMENLGFKPYPATRAVDTLAIARRKFPGANNTLDALCKRFSIDNSNRVKHGALLDAELLADVYLELMGGRQTGLGLMAEEKKKAAATETVDVVRNFREPRAHAASEEELARHKEFISKIENNLW
ncbi:DNA polymerase III subunit epsilon [Pseudemcibacter aquimaris]|uniref:DNA polymerase III subunit epsilon n=1 Tax=Pseudemcibacter aquimaris TaxID=2857064 RepID=UPI0020138538|nr:DNA polymerase III subunit epsilon [Pseudemcibacter aquimaris]MCC3861824.1 DNA polymerase III subunit epsilon [Pseudemcibacter aquimaris]WDU58579.1 DNA polymerase III subunit epsilon [Pseudemcibacter aquimaris]